MMEIEKESKRVPKEICELAKELALLIDKIDKKHMKEEEKAEGTK
jgi:hypothetical protein